MKKLILASQSPRRKELLRKAGLSFIVVPSAYEEDMTLALSPTKLAKHLSYEKAKDVSKKYSDAIIIAADTFIVHYNTIVGKPQTKEKAIETLRKLNNSRFSIVSGLTVIDTQSNKKICTSITTYAHMKKLTNAGILNYVATGESLDCAGAFNVRGEGRLIIDKIEGDYTNIMGLPMRELQKILQPHGIQFRYDTEKWLQNELAH